MCIRDRLTFRNVCLNAFYGVEERHIALIDVAVCFSDIVDFFFIEVVLMAVSYTHLQLEHADKWLLFPDNIGTRIAIDESSQMCIRDSYYDVAIAHYLLQPEMSHSINRLPELYLKKILPDYQLPATEKANKFNPALSLEIEDIAKVACALSLIHI